MLNKEILKKLAMKNRETQPQKSLFFMKKSLSVFLVLACVLLNGCTGEMAGKIGGGSIGALIGSQIGSGSGRILATAIGAVAGSALGGAMGKKFDQEDQKKAYKAAQKAACTGQCVQWINPNSGAYGTWYAGPVRYTQWGNPNSGFYATQYENPVHFGVQYNKPISGPASCYVGPVYHVRPRYQCYRQLKCVVIQPNGQAVTFYVDAFQGYDGDWYME